MLYKYLMLALYFAVLFAIGIYASRKVKTLKDFYVGGKDLGYWVVAFSARATGESGWLLLGLTGMGAIGGVHAFWVVLGEVLGVTLAWFFMAKPFKSLTDQYNSITIPDYLESRFKAKTNHLRIVAAFILAVFVTIYISAQIDATGSAFESFLGINYYAGAIVGFVIVLAYTTTGGFIAVAWSDLFQGLMMLAGLVVLPITAYLSIKYSQDIPSIAGRLESIDPDLLNIWGKGGFSTKSVLTSIAGLAVGLGFLGAPQVFVRFISIRDESEIDKGRWVAIIFTILTDVSAVLIGMLGRVLLTDTSLDELGNGAQNVLPIMVETLFHPVLVGLYIAIVLSAIMSTIDSLLVVASSALTRDLYQKVYHPELSDEQTSKLMRKVTLFLSLCALALALSVSVLSPNRTIYWFVVFGWSGIAASFCPMMILSLFYKGYTAAGAITSMLIGFICVPVFKFLLPRIPEVGEYFNAVGELTGPFILSMLFGVIVSRYSKHPST